MAWSILVDENLEPNVARVLRKEGHTTEHVTENLGAGSSDGDVLAYACENNMVVITNDVTDFKDVPLSDHEGLIILHDGDKSAFEIASAVMDVVEAYPSQADLVVEYLDSWF